MTSSSIVCVLDFDNTVTQSDCLDQLIECVRGRDTMLDMARRYDDGELSHDEYLCENFAHISNVDIADFLQQHPPETLVDPGLAGLLNVLADRKIAYYVVSFGLKLFITHALSRVAYQPAAVYANDYVDGRLVLHDVHKDRILMALRDDDKQQIVFVGDGTSDIAAVDSDVPTCVFAKRGFSLERHCRKTGRAHNAFTTLAEVAEHVRNMP